MVSEASLRVETTQCCYLEVVTKNTILKNLQTRNLSSLILTGNGRDGVKGVYCAGRVFEFMRVASGHGFLDGYF
jgi:hypothetical protein